jgi:sodium-dependent phosphate cotransporter
MLLLLRVPGKYNSPHPRTQPAIAGYREEVRLIEAEPHAPPAEQATQQPRGPRPGGRIGAILQRILALIIGLLLFMFALELLKKGAGSYGRQIVGFLDVTTPASALGFGWLLAYIFLSGSPVAAIAVSFFASGTIDALQTFTMITGSRLGASLIVLFVGFVYYLRGHRRGASIAIGVLALLVTAAIYLPALAVGYWLLSTQAIGVLQASANSPLASVIDMLIDPIVALVAAWLPDWALFGVGAGTLLAAFALLDRALPEMDAERSAFGRIGRLVYRPATMFILGAAVTTVTLSVSVSLSILVPLSAKGMVRRENTLPYIMGANITTFIDTLVAALIVGGPAAFTIVLVEMVSVAMLSLLVLTFAYRPFASGILRLQELIIRDNRSLAGFLGVMLVIPLLLLFVRI